MMTTRWITLACLTTGLVGAGSAFAGVVSPAPTAASGPFDPGYLIVSPAGGNPTTPAQTNQQVAAGNSLAQTFVTGAGFQLDRIQILIGGAGGGTIRLNLYPEPVGGADTDGFVNTSFSTDLFNGGAGLEVTVNPSPNAQLLTFDLTGGDEIFLAAATKYALEVDVLTGQFSWQRSNQSEYPNGNLYAGATELNFNGTLPANNRGQRNQVGGQPQRDAFFALYAVPEPASMLSLGATSLLFRRRRA